MDTIRKKRKPRQSEIEFSGQITSKTVKRKYDGPFKGSDFFVLEVRLENPPPLFPGFIRVLKDKLSLVNWEGLWEALLTSQCWDKRYLFTCQKRGGTYTLIRWEELGSAWTPQQWEKKTNPSLYDVPTVEKIKRFKETGKWEN